MLDLQIIGAIVICLFVIGLAGALVIGCKVSKNNENITGRDSAGQVSKNSENSENITGYYPDVYYPGLLDRLRMARRRTWTGYGQDAGYYSFSGRDLSP